MESFSQKGLKNLSRLLQFFSPKTFSHLAHLLSYFNRVFHFKEWKDTCDALQIFFASIPNQQIKNWAKFIFWSRALKQLEFFLFPSLTIKTITKFVIFDPKKIEAFYYSQNGNLFVGYHLGNSNWFPAVFSTVGMRIHSIREERIFWFNHISNPGEIFRPGDGKKIIKKLQNKENVSMAADVFYKTKNWVEVIFLGKKIKWPSHFTRLAKLSKAQVHLFFTPLLPNGKVKILIKTLPMPDFSSKFFEQELVKLYVEELEKFIIKSPEQWLRWRFLNQLIS